MEGDVHVGGELFIMGKGETAKQSASKSDSHFTVLGFTAATGEPIIMCAIIFEGEELRPECATGLDLFAPVEGNENDRDFFRRNSGKGKRFPLGPTCFFRGKEVPCVHSISPRGSIEGQILAEFLGKMGEMNLFPRETHLKPFLLLDGHGSRLQLPFLQYIHSEEHPWHVCLGLPYGTSFWQVGDSLEQNRAFKMNLTKAKRELVHKKWRCGMSKDARVEKHDIMLIILQAWDKSFGKVATNQKVIAARGWNPLTRNHGLLC
jgi:hypothetical protein